MSAAQMESCGGSLLGAKAGEIQEEEGTVGKELAGGGERRWRGGNNFVPISQMRKVRPREVMGDLES